MASGFVHIDHLLPAFIIGVVVFNCFLANFVSESVTWGLFLGALVENIVEPWTKQCLHILKFGEIFLAEVIMFRIMAFQVLFHENLLVEVAFEILLIIYLCDTA